MMLRVILTGVIASLLTTIGAVAMGQAPMQVDPGLYAGMQWRSIGPYRSGNIYNVTGVPGDPTVYYLALPEGGVWKTTDGGTVWKPIFDREAVPSIGAVMPAPSDPKVVYVGTGASSGWSFTPGRGVYKSTDAGATWQRIGLDGSAYIPALFVDPHDSKLVLVAALGPRGAASAAGDAMRGVYRSADGGATWQHTLTINNETGVADMAWDYADPQFVYAVTQRGGGVGARGVAGQASAPLIYKSSDEGVTWRPLSGDGLPADARSGTIAVASGTHGQRVYLETGGLAGGRAAGVYRSDDGGAHWRLGTEHIGSAGGRIYADPQNPDVVYLMGTSIYRSTDGAATFTAFKGSPGGDDDRDLWIDPTNPKRMIAGVDQGPTITVDGGQTWTPWYSLPNGQFYDVFADNQFPYMVYGAQQDSGTAATLSRSDFGEITFRDWYPVGGFEAGYIAVDPADPRWVFTQGWYHVLRRFDRQTGQTAVVYTPAPEDRFGSMPPTVYSPENPKQLYMAAQYVMYSDDNGATWHQLGNDLTQRPAPAGAAEAPAGAPGRGGRGGTIQALAPSPLSAQVLWAGSSNGVIQLTRDGGKTWSNVSPPAMAARDAVNHIDASHHDLGTAYAAVETAGGPVLYRTEDYGKTWSEIIHGLEGGVRTRVVREDPENARLLYAGTEDGAWVSFDQGDQWQPLQLNLPHTVVSDMTVHGDDLVISTYGRSFWILDDVTPLRQAAAAAASAAYLYKPEVAMRVRWSENQDTPLPPEVPAGQNPPEGAIIDYALKTAATGPMKLDIYDRDGRLVREFTDHPAAVHANAPNVPDYWFESPIGLETSAGQHRLAWDLREPLPKALTYSYYGNILDYTEYTLTWHAILGHTPEVQPLGPIVPPGTYQVKLTVDGTTYTQPLVVKNDPRSAASLADVTAQYALEQQVVTGLAASYDAYSGLEAVRDALAKQTTPEAQALGQALAKVTGFGLANRDLGRRLQDLDFGDYRPTASDVAAVEASCRQISDAAAQLAAITLTVAGLPPLPQVPAHPCAK